MSFYDTGDLSGKSQFDVQVETVEDFCKKNSPNSCPFEQVVRKAMVSSVDEAVGNIIETLEATGVVQGHLAIVNASARKMTITLAKWQHKWKWQ